MRFTEFITESSKICPQCGMRGCTCKPGTCKCKPKPGYPKQVDEAANPAQQAAIAIAKKKEQGVAEGLNEFAQGDFNGSDDSNDLQLYLNVAKKLNMKKYKPSTAHNLIAKKMAELVDVVDDDKVDYARHMARKAQGLPNMLEQGVAEEGKGLWANIHAKQNRIKKGSGEHMRKPGSKGAPTAKNFKDAASEGIEEDWQKVNKKDKTDGMSKKAVSAYRRENPGSKLKTAVTTKPSKLKKGSKAANRRKSFCARMSGMKKAHASAKTKRDPDSPINKALRRWNCESVEQMQELVMLAEQLLVKTRNQL